MLKRLAFILVAGLMMAGGFGLMFWVHHMLVLGLKPYLDLLFIGIVILFIMPGIVVGVSWLRWTLGQLFAVGAACWMWWAIAWFTIKGNSTVDIPYRDIHYIIRGFPFLLYPPIIFLVYSRLYYLLEGRVQVSRGPARFHFWVTLLGAWLVMLPAANEWAGMPARFIDAGDSHNRVYFFLLFNGLIGVVVLAVLFVQVVFAAMAVYGFVRGRQMGTKGKK
jgi:cytochrome c oxidase subunit 1